MKIKKKWVSWEEFEKALGGTWTPTAHNHVKVDIIDTPWAWTDVSKTGSNLTDLATRQHVGLTDVTADQHHAQLHASSHEVGGGDLVNHDDLTGFVAAEHLSLPNTMANVLSSYLINDLSDVVISAPENGEFLQYFSATSEWKNISEPPPATHASTHHVGGSDLVNHDSLTGFVAAEHVSLPNTIANVLSNHTKAIHDSLDIDARYIDGKEVVAATPTDGHVLTYVSASTRWEDKAPSAGTLAALTDTNISVPESGELLEYSEVDSKWHNVSDPPPSTHASTHHVGGSDLVNHDSLTGFVAAEHVSLPNTIANVLSDHNKTIHDSLDIDARYIDGKEVVAATPTNDYVLTYDSGAGRWEDKPTGTPGAHATTHETGGSDQLHHDDLDGFLASEHVALPNTIANVLSNHTQAVHNSLNIDADTVDSIHLPSTCAAVLSNHTKAVHDALDIDARYIDGVEVVAVTPGDGEVLTYVLANTRWEALAPGAGTLAGLTDTNIGTPSNGDLLEYWTSDSKWHNVSDLAPTAHAASHHTGGGDLVNHDSLTGFVAAEHLSLPNTVANVLSDATFGGTINNPSSSYRWVGANNRNSFYTPSGYIQLGPMNASYCHIYTDIAGGFYFNQELYKSGNKIWHAGNDGAASGLDADKVDGLHASGLGVPSGMIAIFDAACPDGWTRVSAWDAKFLRGSGTYGGTGGTADHLHTVNPPDTTSGIPSATDSVDEGTLSPISLASATHTHQVDITQFNSGSEDNLPPYINVVFCKKD